MSSSLLASRLEVLAAAALFSTGGAAIKATSLTGWQTACFRSCVAAAVLLLLLPQARRGWSWRAAVVGVAYAGTLILFVLANKNTTSANAIFLQSAGPLYLIFIGPWILKEHTRREDYAFLALMAIGLVLFFLSSEAPQSTAPNPALGNVLGAFCGLSWAFTVTGLRWFSREEPGGSIKTVAIGNLMVCAAALPGAVSAPVSLLARDAAIIGYLGVFQIGLAYWLVTRGVSRLPALETSMLILLEPALNPVWSWMVHGERPSGLAVAGGVCILSATAGMVLAGRKRT
ncbi:MAG TPA: EamA/RhaT family transporter [Solibacterales bacterium]|nr:EamA/RhaT family transporter [Bryobacterales bacterium]